MKAVCNECGIYQEMYDERSTIKDPQYCLVCFAAMTGFYFNHITGVFEEEDEIIYEWEK